MGVTVLVGTAKGGFVLRSDDGRERWEIEGPIFKGWKVTAAERLSSGDYLLGTTSDIYGTAMHKSADLNNWRQIERAPKYEADSGRQLTQIWKFAENDGVSYAGVSEAGLFRSEDEGESWEPVVGLNDHPTRRAWMPGAGGLCAHSILFDSARPERMWCGISAVGVLRSDDGGKTWAGKNDGIPIVLEDREFDEIGFCVHGLAPDPDNADVIYRQDHQGVFRTGDGGENWERIENGLTTGFGFPIAVDQKTRAIYIVPLESDEYRIPTNGKLRVYRSTDGGDSWTALTSGLPQENAYAGVLRGAMDADQLDPCGVYIGTTSGDIYFSNNGGEHWSTLPCRLPRVLSIDVFVES